MRAESPGREPLQRFKPTNGLFVGVAGLLGAAFAICYVAWSLHTIVGLRIGLGAAFMAVVVWATQLRPRAAAYPRSLVLSNTVTDTEIPYAAVEEVAVGQSLAVWAEGRRHLCIGIGNKVREEMRDRRRRMRADARSSSSSRWHEFASMAERATPETRDVSYTKFVVTRIEELVDAEHREHPGEHVPPVVRRVALLPVVGLAVTAAAFVASLLV